MLSLGVNVATRVPSALAMLLVLPMLRFDLGPEKFAFMLGALALGSATTVFYGGFATMARRLIGEAYAAGDRDGEATGVMSLLAVNSILLIASLLTIAVYASTQPDSGRLFFIAGLVALITFVNTFDNVRAAYNEHYVTAIVQIASQAAVIMVAIFVQPVRRDPILASLVVVGHGLLTSLVAGTMLIRSRPYLLKGIPSRVWWLVRNGGAVGLADGLLGASMSVSVVWVEAHADALTSGWYAALNRLFQTFLVPVTLLLLPLSSYIRLKWNERSPARQRAILWSAALGGLVYGVLASAALFVASTLYLDKLLHLPGPGALEVILPIYALFAATIAYRSYASIVYVVADGSRFAMWIVGGVAVSCALAAAASLVVDPLHTIAIYATPLALALLASGAVSVLALRKTKD